MPISYSPPGPAPPPVFMPGTGNLSDPSNPFPKTVFPGAPAGINVDMGPAFTNYQANPLYQLAMQGAGIGPGLSQMSGIASGLQKAFKGNLDYANQALQLAFDPQQSYFKQYQQDLIDATRAGEAARGIAMTPYGAGIESAALGRFYNQWQSEQVQRMATGASAATALQGMWEQAQQAAAGIYNDEITAQLKEYGLKGDMIGKALDEILSAMDIQSRVAIAEYQGQTGIQEALIGAAGRGGGGGGGARGGGLGMMGGGGGGGDAFSGAGSGVSQALSGQ
jgi:hypothetical protein